MISSDSHREGIGEERKLSSVISVEDKGMMWRTGVLGLSDPKVLQRTVFFFFIGMHFVLWGVEEQYSLKPAQLFRDPPDVVVYHERVYYQYTKHFNKNNQH